MGVAVGDYDNDGRMDLFVTTFANDNYVLFHNEGKGAFSDRSFQSRIGEKTIPYLGWATFFLDFDNDGFKDLFAGSGHVYPEVAGKLGAETTANRYCFFAICMTVNSLKFPKRLVYASWSQDPLGVERIAIMTTTATLTF